VDFFQYIIESLFNCNHKLLTYLPVVFRPSDAVDGVEPSHVVSPDRLCQWPQEDGTLRARSRSRRNDGRLFGQSRPSADATSKLARTRRLSPSQGASWHFIASSLHSLVMYFTVNTFFVMYFTVNTFFVMYFTVNTFLQFQQMSGNSAGVIEKKPKRKDREFV